MNIRCFPTCPGVCFGDMAWSAVTSDYDADCDEDGYFSTSPVGHGATESEAIADLCEQLAELEAS